MGLNLIIKLHVSTLVKVSALYLYMQSILIVICVVSLDTVILLPAVECR